MLRSDSVKTVSKRKPIRRIGAIIGTTTWRNRCMKLVPSTRAASRISVGTDVNPASSTMAENGNVRHTLTMMQAAIARWGSPSHTGQLGEP